MYTVILIKCPKYQKQGNLMSKCILVHYNTTNVLIQSSKTPSFSHFRMQKLQNENKQFCRIFQTWVGILLYSKIEKKIQCQVDKRFLKIHPNIEFAILRENSPMQEFCVGCCQNVTT